jgi:hypothetical protein
MEPLLHLMRSYNLMRSYKWTAVAGAIWFAASAGGTTGCFTDKRPTQVMVTPVTSEIRPAKPPDCAMPVLTEEPTTGYQELAIVEAWSDVNEDPAKVLPELKRQACATGAQALLILGGKKQNEKTQLYGVTPNQNETDVTAGNGVTNQSGQYINKMQYTPKIGEGGHIGYYIDGLAIEYTANANTAAAVQQPKP